MFLYRNILSLCATYLSWFNFRSATAECVIVLEPVLRTYQSPLKQGSVGLIDFKFKFRQCKLGLKTIIFKTMT